MRIGVITTSYPRDRDDPAGTFVAGHVSWLRSQGHTIDVVCAGDRARPHEPWQPGVTILPVRAPPGLFYAGGAPDALAARPGLLIAAAGFSASLARAVARHGRAWQLVYAHWLVPGALAALLAPRAAPVVAIAHSGDVHLACQLGLATPLGALARARRMHLSFVSAAVRERFVGAIGLTALARHVRRESRVTPMGIDVARFRAVRAQRAAGRPGHTAAPGRSDEQGRPTVLFLGRLVPIKGAHVLVAATGLLAAGDQAAPHVVPRVIPRVVIAGAGPEHGRLERAAAGLPGQTPGQMPGQTIELVGEARGPARDDLLARADLLVIPSVPVAGQRSEGAPVTAFEAMAAGVPVVASRTGGLAALPDDAVTFVEPGSPRCLADAITALLADPARRAAQVDRAAAFAETLDWSRIGPRLLVPTTPLQ